MTWGPFAYSGPLARGPLIDEGTADARLSEGAVPTARKRFTSTVETPERARGPEQVVSVIVEVRVVRDDLKQGVDGVVKVLFGHIPDIIRPQVASFLRPRIDSLLGDVVRR